MKSVLEKYRQNDQRQRENEKLDELLKMRGIKH